MPSGESPAPHLRRLHGFALCDAPCERAFPRVLDTACRAPQFLRSLLLPVSWLPSCPSRHVEPLAQRVRPVLTVPPSYTCLPSSSSKGAFSFLRLWARAFGRLRSRDIHSLT